MAYTTIDKPSDYFNTVLYTGNGTAIGSGGQAVTGVGFQPDLTWIKNRSADENHSLTDSVRGVTKTIRTDVITAETTDSEGQTAFGSDGFTVGSEAKINGSGNSIVAWNWKSGGSSTSTNSDGDISGTQTVNQTAGFSITTYNGNGGSNQSLGHGLGATPKIYINKRRDNTGQWLFVTTIIDGSLDYLFLETTGAKSNSSRTAPTSSVVYLENGGDANESGGTHVMYAFAEKKGYSKFGSYTGNGNVDGTFIYTGFKPAFVILKRTNTSNNWIMFDNKRDPHNEAITVLFPNTSDDDDAGTGANDLDFVANGIKIREDNGECNGSGDSYIYMAFAESPFVTSSGIPTTAR